jgi:hypothetical protein
VNSTKPEESLTKAQLRVELAPIISRVDRLWKEIFPGPDSPPGYGERLRVIEGRLVELDKQVTIETTSLRQQLKETIEILAELRKIVDEQLRGSGGAKLKEAAA